ncbi:hypothetical protein CHS0354_022786 [Potamilus streckersoni]|uniref:Kinesin motor domain-containing protein n=1 Tax=Potamilus streckersoni TaxID=2493646 RepID=A0AAE0VMJ6_9BIVA|nr:hypothetical protein CHS0354_022786 [Potamilus streckersoni]
MAQLPKSTRLLSDIVPMNVDDVNDKTDSDDDPLMKTPRKNLLLQFTDTQIDIGNERMKVYLRIRPLTKAEIDRQENQKCLEVESAQTVLAHAPKDSHSYRNTTHGVGKTTNKFTFSRIFKEDTSQKEFFKDTMLSSVKDFIDGQNCLVFSYGVTSSGKTYTIQGNPSDAGVLPRALDVLFNSISGKQWSHMNLKPTMFTDVIRLTEDEELREKKIKEKILRLIHEDDVDVMSLLGEDASDISQITNTTTSSESSNVSSIHYGPSELKESSVINEEIFSDLKNRVREETAVSVEDQGQIRFSVWVSFAEIYNEQIFDLLEAIPKSKKARRTVLKLSEDKNGSPYIKGLKQVHVESADEAYKLLVIGQRNLRTACTKLNHNSSRSHCIYNIKVLRVVDKGAPHVARVSMLSFCDLAGSERYSKTQNNGERLREAGNINTSLMTLGRCIETLRYNQTHKENKIIPFRDSKLTRLFQNFFNGTGKASMIINISQCASLFDETIHVLKFSAIATKIIVTQKAEPPPKFQISSLSGSDDTRPSISWATPYTLAKSQFDMESAINMPLPEDDDEDLNESDDGVNSLLQLIEDLRQELVREKRSKVLLEAKIREEVCQEMMKQFVEIENNYSERIRFTEQRAEDMADRRIQIYLDAVSSDSQSKKQLEHVEDDDNEYVSSILLHQEQVKVQVLETKTKDLEAEIAELKSQLTEQNHEKSTMKAEILQLEQQQKVHSANHHADLDQLKKQLAEAESTIQKLQSQIHKKAEKTTDYDMEKSIMAEKLEEAREQINSQQAEIKELNEMLTEAGETFENKETEISKLKELCQDYEEKLKTQARTIKALETAAEKSRNAMETADQSLSRREESLAKVQVEMQQLKDELKKTTNTCHFIEESLKEKTTEVDTLKHKVQVYEDSLKEKASEVETWKHKFQVQEESLKEITTEAETWKHKVQVQEESLKEKTTEVETWKHKVQVQEESLKKKTTEVETWKHKVQVQEECLKEKTTEVETWKHKFQLEEEESSKSEQALINGYKMEIANYKSQIHQFKVQLYGHGSKSPISKSPLANSPLRSPSKTYAGMNTSLLIPDVDDTIFSHREKTMKNLTQEMDYMSQELKKANEKIEILDQKAKFSKTEMRSRCEKEKKKGEQLKKDMEAKEELLNHYKFKVEELEKNIQNINSLLSEKSAEIMKLMTKNEELETLNNGLKEMINKSTLDLECKEKEIKLLSPKKCELDSLKGNDSPGSIASLQKKMKKMRHETEHFQAVIAKHEEENKKLKSDLEKLKLAYRAKEEAVQELRNSVKEADFRVDEKEAEMMDLQEQLAQKEKTIKNLEGQLKLKEDDLVKTSEELVISNQDKERHYRKAEEIFMLIQQKEEELVRLKECNAEKEVQTDIDKKDIDVKSQQKMEQDTQTDSNSEGGIDNESLSETGKLRSVLEEKNKELELISDKLIIALQEKEEFASILRERRDSEEVTFCKWAGRNEGMDEQGETCRQVGNAMREKDSDNCLEEDTNTVYKKEQKIKELEKVLNVRERKVLDKEQVICNIEEHLTKQAKEVQDKEVLNTKKDEELRIKAKKIKDSESDLFTEKEKLTLKEKELHNQEKLLLEEKEKLVIVRKELEHLQEELKARKDKLDSAEQKFEIRVKDIAAKEKDIETKKKHMIEKEAELTEKEAELDKKEEQLMDEDYKISEKGSQIEEKEVRLEKFASDLKEKEKYVKQTESQLDERVKMLRPKEVEFEDKRKELCSLEEELSVIKSEFDKQQAELASRKKEISIKEVELEKKSQQLCEREVLIKQREDLINKKETDKMNLENEQLKSKDSELICKLEEIKKLKESIIELKTYERQVDEKITEIKMKDEELNNLELKNESLEKEMRKMEEKTKTFEDLQVSFKELKHKLEEKEKEIAKLNDARMELAEVKCAAHTHKTLYEKVKQEYIEARKELEKLYGLEKCVSEKENALKEAKNTVNALSSELSDLKEKLQLILTQKENLEKETERLQSQLFETGDVKKMKEEYEMTKTRLDETLAKLLENEAKLKETESKVKELDEQNKKMADELCNKIPDGSSPEKSARHYRKEKIQMQNTLIEHKVKIESLQAKIQDLECKIESEKLQRSTSCVVPSASDPSLLNKIQKLSAELMEKDNANRSLIKEVSHLKDKIEELEVKLKEAYSTTPHRKVPSLSTVVASPTLSHELEQSHDREQKLRCQLRQASQTIQELNSQISGLRDEIRSKETSDTTNHDTIKSLQDKWHKEEEKLREKHQEELRQLQEELVLREQKILTKSAIVKSLREQIKTERDKFEIFATDKKNNDEVLQQVKEALKVQESMLKDYDNALQIKEEEITVKQTEYEKLQEKYHELLKSTGRSDKELLAQNRSFTKVEAERDLLLKQNLELQDEIKKITNEKDRVNLMIRENNSELKEMEKALTEAKLQHEELKQKMLNQSSFEVSVLKQERDKKYHDLENKMKEKTEFTRELQTNLRRQEEKLKNTEKDLQHKEDTIKAWKEERDKLVSGLEMILKKQIEEIKQLKEERDFALMELQRKGANQEEQLTVNEKETSRNCHKGQVKQQNIKDDEKTSQNTQKIKVEKIEDEDDISEKINTTTDRSSSTSSIRRTTSKNSRKRQSPVITPIQEPPASKRIIRESDISVTSNEDISGHLQIDATPPVAAKNLKRNKRKYTSSTNLSNQPNDGEKSEDEKSERPQRKAKKTARGKIGSIVNSFRESSLPRTARRILHSIVEATSPLSSTSQKKEDSSESVQKSTKKSKDTGSKENISSNVTPNVDCLDPPAKNSQQPPVRRRHKLYKDETYISEPMECGQFVKSQDNEVHKVETRRTRGRKCKVTDI